MSLQNMDISEGVIWEKNLPSPPVAGIEINDNNLFFADASGNIYSCWMDSGLINWKRKLNRENVQLLFTDKSGLSVISCKPDAASSFLRTYSFEQGIVSFETNIPFITKDSYTADPLGIIVHTSNKIIVINSIEKRIELFSIPPNIQNITAVIRGGDLFYLIDDKSKVYQTDPAFRFIKGYYQFNGYFSGNASYYKSRLYISTSEGTKILNTLAWTSESAILNWNTGASAFLFDSSGTTLFTNSDNKDLNYHLFSDFTFNSSSAASYSPLILSQPLSITAFIDSKGNLTLMDSRTGHYINSKFVGSIDRPFLKIAKDYNSKAVFIPLSSPAKIFCYSLDFAASQKKLLH